MAAVAFAYVANKLYVFSSKTHGIKDMLREMLSFIAMRLVSLGMEFLLLYLLVDLLHMNHLVAKIITNVVVVISNYVFSKLFIFKGGTKRGEKKSAPGNAKQEEPHDP